MEKYDLIIIGGGPAGLTAAIYALRANKKVLLIESVILGGQVGATYEVRNYPGFENISGPDLVEKMANHALSFGLVVKYGKVNKIKKQDKMFEVKTHEQTFLGSKVILATGAKPRPLNIEINRSLIGRGINYCATCDGSFYKNKKVAVVGAGNTAFENAKYLAKLAQKVYIIHRNDKFRAEKVLYEELKSFEKKGIVKFVLNSSITKVLGTETVSGMEIVDVNTNKTTTLDVEGIFVSIGTQPDTDWLVDIIKLDDNGYIVVDKNMESSIKGIYAVGDVICKELRQIVTACADGAIAGTKASQ